MPKYPESVIAEIRDRVSIVELVGGYVNLKRSGRNHQGLCPFHQEKTPSFNVNEDRKIYHCFGCGVTGDCYRFLMEHDHLSFPESVRTLAEQVGVDLTPYETGGRHAAEEFDDLYRAHAIAVRIYRAALLTDEGKAGRAELARRGLGEEIVERYRVGVSPESWDRLLKTAEREGVPPSALERAGLAIRRDNKPGHYDRFRGRLMFPIETVARKVVGFGGRVLGEGEPKYLNSPETPLFQKRRMLYGLPQARDGLREQREAILVEGYTDVLGLAQAGFTNVLASLGTAFTEDHARLLARTADRVLVVFDGDDAGQNAARMSAGPLIGAGLDVRIVLLPVGQDPDSLVREQGPEAFAQALERARPALDVVLGDEIFGTGVERERAIRRGLDALAGVTDPLRRRVYVEELATRTGLPGEVLEQQLRDQARSDARSREKRSSGSAAPPPPARVAPRMAETARPSPLERTFLAVLLHDAELGAQLLGRFRADDFDHPLVARIVARAAEIASSGPYSPDALLASFEEDGTAYGMLGELTTANEFSMEVARQAEDCRVGMERRALEREMKQVTLEMKKANARGENERMREFIARREELRRGIEALRTPRNPYESR